MSTPLWAFDEPPKATQQSASERYRALLKDYEKAQQGFSEAYTKATTDAERQKVIQQKYPQPERFAARFLELAEQQPQDPAALESLVWICSFASSTPQEESICDERCKVNEIIAIFERSHCHRGANEKDR